MLHDVFCSKQAKPKGLISFFRPAQRRISAQENTVTAAARPPKTQ